MDSTIISVPTALAYSALGFSIVFVGLVFLMIVIKVMAALMHTSKKETAPAPAPVVVAAAPAPAATGSGRLAPGSAGDIKLHTVSPKEAAMIMAIVANQLQKPLNELRFKSIKEVK